MNRDGRVIPLKNGDQTAEIPFMQKNAQIAGNPAGKALTRACTTRARHHLEHLWNIVPSLLILLLTAPAIASDAEWEEVTEGSNSGPQVTASQRDEDFEEDDEDPRAKSREAERLRTASSTTVRRFHEVLDELLAEFGYDVKMGQLKGLKNVSIRRVEVNDALPKTYENYVELLVAERIRENSRVKLINCVPCKTRSSTLVEGKLMITSPTTNMARMEQAATQLGIDNFMDVILVYHTTHMVLALSIFDTATKEQVWARTYNSETIKSRFQKLAIDYRQVAKSRPGEDYVPEYRMLLGLGGASVPNVAGGDKERSFMNLQFRGAEKFNNRRSEFGILFSLLLSTRSLLREYPNEGGAATAGTAAEAAPEPTTTKLKPFRQAISLYGTYGHTFVGSVESYNDLRHSLHAGLGGLLSVGYIAPSVRFGWDIYFGRRFAMTFGAFGIAPASILVDGEYLSTKGGVGGDLVLSLNF